MEGKASWLEILKKVFVNLSPAYCQELHTSATFIIVLRNLGVEDVLVRAPKVTMLSNCVNRRYPQNLVAKASGLH